MSESTPPVVTSSSEPTPKPARYSIHASNGVLMLVIVLVMVGLVATHPWVKAGVNSQGVGELISSSVGMLTWCLLFAWLLSWASFHLAKRSRRVASVVFGIVFVLFAVDGMAGLIAHRRNSQRALDAEAQDIRLAGQRAKAGLTVGDETIAMETLIRDAKSDTRAALVLLIKQRSDWFEETVTALGAKKAVFEADGGYHPDIAISQEALQLQIERARELTKSSAELVEALSDYDKKLRAEIATTKAPKEYAEELLASYYSLFEPESMRTYFSLWENYYAKGLEFLELAQANAGNWGKDEDGEYTFSSPEAEAAYQKIAAEFDAASDELEAFLLAMQARAAEINAGQK